MYNKCPLLCISFFRSVCPGNFPLSNNCSALLFCFYFFISSILACLQVVYSSKYCCWRSIRLFDWICCGIYHQTSISILQVHCYPYRNRYHFSVLKISFIFIYHLFIQYQSRFFFAGNIGNIPLVLIAALCRDPSNPFGDSDKCNQDGNAYISFGQWVRHTFPFSRLVHAHFYSCQHSYLVV